MPVADPTCPVDTVQFVSAHLEDEYQYDSARSAERDAKIIEWLTAYHTDASLTEAERLDLRNRVIMNTWYLLPSILKKRNFPSTLFEDTLQNMVINLMTAIEKFDVTRGSKFSSYISGYMLDAISTSARDEAVVCQPASIRKQSIQYLKAQQEYGSEADAAAELGQAPEFTTRVNPDDCADLGPYDADIEDRMHLKDMCIRLEVVLSNNCELLTDKERMVLAHRTGVFGAPKMTLDQVAEAFHAMGWRATKEWIFQLERRARAKVRLYFEQSGVSESGIEDA
jgi:DNA-directed RNA polymerase sigma subunit (sigma70/sigma32)